MLLQVYRSIWQSGDEFLFLDGMETQSQVVYCPWFQTLHQKALLAKQVDDASACSASLTGGSDHLCGWLVMHDEVMLTLQAACMNEIH